MQKNIHPLPPQTFILRHPSYKRSYIHVFWPSPHRTFFFPMCKQKTVSGHYSSKVTLTSLLAHHIYSWLDVPPQ